MAATSEHENTPRKSQVQALSARRISKKGRDFYPTPAWAVIALTEKIDISGLTIWEPAAGKRHLADALRPFAKRVCASDIHSRRGVKQHDFLSDDPLDCDGVITNPPYSLASQFAIRAIDLQLQLVALLVRIQFLEGIRRYNKLFCRSPPSEIYVFSERVPFYAGRINNAVKSTSCHCWVVWRRGVAGTRLDWFAPGTRARLSASPSAPAT